MCTPVEKSTDSGADAVSPGRPAAATRASSTRVACALPERPRSVAVGHPERPPQRPGVQPEARREEVLQVGRLVETTADLDVDPARGPGPAPPAGAVGEGPALRVDRMVARIQRQPGPAVRHPQGESRGRDHGEPLGVERAEHHAVPAGVVDGVQPHVGLQEGAQPRHRSAPAQGAVDEPEGHEPHPGAAVVDVGSHARRHHRRHHLRRHPPVQERDVVPPLAQHLARTQRRALRVQAAARPGVVHASTVPAGTMWS